MSKDIQIIAEKLLQSTNPGAFLEYITHAPASTIDSTLTFWHEVESTLQKMISELSHTQTYENIISQNASDIATLQMHYSILCGHLDPTIVKVVTYTAARCNIVARAVLEQ
jgi:hypothetical protein